MNSSTPSPPDRAPLSSANPVVRTRQEIEAEIAGRLAAERARLHEGKGLPRTRTHFVTPPDRPFTADERDRVTILIGGMTAKHDAMLVAALQMAGYRAEALPTPDVAAFQTGKEFANNGQCNPTYFLVGHLLTFLQGLEAQGLSRSEIVERYVYLTAGSCGPCRFGMYEAEYRLALRNAGYEGFRILLLQQDDGLGCVENAGFTISLDLGLMAWNTLDLGDILNDVGYQLRPYETTEGETDRVLDDCVSRLTEAIRTRPRFEVLEHTPSWLSTWMATASALRRRLDTVGKVVDHLFGRWNRTMLVELHDRLSRIEVDRFRVKPIVKVTGEFWAQTTEGDGNFNMFRFLEREGAQVLVEPLGTWSLYLFWVARQQYATRRRLRLSSGPKSSVWARARERVAARIRLASYDLGSLLYAWHYRRVGRALGAVADPLPNLDELGRLAKPYYHVLAMGGEGHLEVGKNIYYTLKKKAHMVLSLKPFGCMPSTQSDGVQSAVMSHFKDMLFLPIETSGEGEVNAHSRVQMTLGEAKVKAKTEFEDALASTGKTLDELRAFVDDHPELRHPFYRVPRTRGLVGTAANFVCHVSDVIDGRTELRKVPNPVVPRSPSSRTGLGQQSAA